MHVAVYASLNTAAAVRQAWGLDDGRVEAIREQLVRGDTAAAGALVPPGALEDLVFESPDPAPIAAIAREHGVSSLAVPGFDPATVAGHIDWAASVESLLARAQTTAGTRKAGPPRAARGGSIGAAG